MGGTSNFSVELKLAVESARVAGEILRKEQAQGSEVKSEIGRDIKLAADVHAEAAILSRLRAGSTYPILSEEAGADVNFDSEGLRWVVDPLDGTYNFSRRWPICCVSIGLCCGNTPVLGVIYDFLGDVSYEGVVGQGAWRNGEPMRVSSISEPERAMALTGFPAGSVFGRDSLMGFVTQLQRYKKVRLLGSSALSLAWVACGLADLYHEDGINFWDVAAGLALVKAAGGDFVTRPGERVFQLEVFASNGRIAGKLGDQSDLID
ncbi:MAG TPA: inositol monophosphatase family protein [Candidatus Limnocylindria bacterium]|jgi:myo-inositol-1(or 4)-monophosphatase|nr:inositol monophosphatase family protein [Candidatus Limnocylindria bacterium]